jgi:hypothetical protein
MQLIAAAAFLVHKGHKDLLVMMEHLVRKDQLELMDHKGHKD